MCFDHMRNWKQQGQHYIKITKCNHKFQDLKQKYEKVGKITPYFSVNNQFTIKKCYRDLRLLAINRMEKNATRHNFIEKSCLLADKVDTELFAQVINTYFEKNIYLCICFHFKAK